MKKPLQSVSPRLGLWLWWLSSAAAVFVLSLTMRAIVHQPPFTDWAYLAGYSLLFPAVMIGVLRLVALRRNG